ncbi:MAG: deoxyhypusine synthase family protein [Planctomycetota bacterium]|nr:deoxyhypusine synthase family protein [Planctomycetota bacterium]
MSKSRNRKSKTEVAYDDIWTYAPLNAAQIRRRKKLLSDEIRQVRIGRKTTAADLVADMSGMSIQARNLGQCAEVLTNLYNDKRRPTVMLGLAGPLIAAGLRRVIRDLVVGGYVDVVVSTGAILYQDIYQARGHRHYRGTPNADDPTLRDLYIDRIYDTYVDEEKFLDTDVWCGRIADELEAGNYSSRAYLDFVGSKLTDTESIVYQCHRLGVPMFSPALNDSSIGIGLTEHRHRCKRDGKAGIAIDSIRDNYELTQITVQSGATAAIYVAGGVPKNYINDSVVMGYIFGINRGHDYAVQVTTAVVQDGGLSGSTLGEARSWGKIKKKADFAMAWVEPSVSLPLLAAYIFNRHPAPARPRLKLTWDGDILKSLKRKRS